MSSQKNKESMWPDGTERLESILFFSFCALFFSKRLFATIGTTLYWGAAEPGKLLGKS